MNTSPRLESETQHRGIGDVKAVACTTPRWEHALGGFAIGGLMALALIQFKLDARMGHHATLLFAVAAALLAMTRLRRVIWFCAALLVVGLLVIGYTPLAAWLTTPPPPGDPPQSAQAIVVLGAGAHADQTFDAGEQDRVFQAFTLLRSGYAPRIVLPGAPGTWAPYVREHMRQLGFDGEVDEAPLDRPLVNTHDEALAVSRLCRERGWDRIILVTHAWHMRRSAALFEKVGLHVVRAPCNDSEYDLAAPGQIKDRIAAIRDWLHEKIGYCIYRWRGWV